MLLCVFSELDEQSKRIESQFRIARLKYSGGGDWYNDPSAEVNLLKFAKQNAGIDTDPKYEFVEISNDNFTSYPLIFMTGHGNVSFSEYEIKRLRTYLESGGFLYIDDDYGIYRFRMDKKIILLVDDNKDYWTVIREYFYTFTLIACGTIKEAINILDYVYTDYILLDIVLENDFGVNLLLDLFQINYKGKIFLVSSIIDNERIKNIIESTKPLLNVLYFCKTDYPTVRKIIIEDSKKNN